MRNGRASIITRRSVTVSSEDIMKGYKVDADTYIEMSKDELENVALESNRTIDIDEFVPKTDIDPRYRRFIRAFVGAVQGDFEQSGPLIFSYSA